LTGETGILKIMKNTGKCPKCGGKKIITVPGQYGPEYSPNIHVGFLSHAQINRYICSACGYAEFWVPYDDDLKKLEKKYGSVER